MNTNIKLAKMSLRAKKKTAQLSHDQILSLFVKGASGFEKCMDYFLLPGRNCGNLNFGFPAH